MENPYQLVTKTSLVERLRGTGKAWMVSKTCSCAHTHDGSAERPHCGVCSQCVDRRLTCLAAGLTGTDDPAAGYRQDVITRVKSGADLIMVERYYGTALRLDRLADPLTLLATYPELARALRHIAGSPSESLRVILGMTRLHGQQVCDQVGELIAAEGRSVARRQVSPYSLLGVALGASWQPRPPPRGEGELPTPGRPTIDEETFAIRDRGRACWGLPRSSTSSGCWPGTSGGSSGNRRSPTPSGTGRGRRRTLSSAWSATSAAGYANPNSTACRWRTRADATTASLAPTPRNNSPKKTQRNRQRDLSVSWDNPPRASRPFGGREPEDFPMTRPPRPGHRPPGLSLRHLSPERRRLLELIHSMGFGAIRGLTVDHGEPVFTESTDVVRQVKFHGTDYTRPDSADAILGHEQGQRLLAYLEQARDARLLLDIEVKCSLPFLGEYRELRRR